MKNKILILLPTRNRAEKVWGSIKSWVDTRTGRSDLVLGLDKDDKQLVNYVDKYKGYVNAISIGERIRMCPTVNRLVQQYPDYKYYCFIGDDHVFKTKGWDEMMIKKIEQAGGFGVCYGDDQLQGQRLASAFVISKSFIDLQGGYIPYPPLVHMCMDNQVMILAQEFGKLFYMPEIIIEHQHFLNGKSEKDAMYMEVNQTAVVTKDGKALQEWRAKELPKIKKRWENL